MRHFDCAIIGSGPAGQHGAIQAAKLGKQACIIERCNVVGGAMVNTGTIPSKALREAVLYLAGDTRRLSFGDTFQVKRDTNISELIYFSHEVVHHELQVIQEQFDRNNIQMVWGEAGFIDANTLRVKDLNGGTERITADKFLIAVGTTPSKPSSVPFNDTTIVTSDTLLNMKKIPKSMIIVGGGVIGVEYACMIATLGVHVTLVEGRPVLLDFLDTEISDALEYQMRQINITLRLGEKVASIEDHSDQNFVTAKLESGKIVNADALLYAAGRIGTADVLDLGKVGIQPDDRMRLKVNEFFQTNVPHIYAAGDIIGFPALASTSMEQGRIAVCHAFGTKCNFIPHLFPFGIYSIPEISMVGKTEKELTKENIPYEDGVAHYREVARGQLIGDQVGMLKLLVHQQNRQLLGVHAIGSGATELVHIGQAVMTFNGTVDYFVNNVFNYPTLAEAYKVAAFNAINKLACFSKQNAAS